MLLYIPGKRRVGIIISDKKILSPLASIEFRVGIFRGLLGLCWRTRRNEKLCDDLRMQCDKGADLVPIRK